MFTRLNSQCQSWQRILTSCYCRNVGEELAEEGDHVGAMAAITQTKIITQVRREGEGRRAERGEKGREQKGIEWNGREGKRRRGEGERR